VVVPEDNNLIHYRRDNSNGSDQTWILEAIVSNKATGAGSMIQSTFGTPDYPGSFEVVVPEGSNLVHYSRDNTQQNPTWSGPTIIMDNAAGSGALIQSTYGTPDHRGNFEVVVPTQRHPIYELLHFSRDNSTNMQWSFVEIVMSEYNTGGQFDSPSLIQSSYGTPTHPGNFEVIVVDTDSNLLHIWRDNTLTNPKWDIGETVVANTCRGPNALIQSNYGESGNPGDFEVITVPSGSYQHWYRDNGVGQPWYPGPTITSAYDGYLKGPTQRASEAQAKRNLSPLPRTGAVYTPPIALK
jgi:hypothetical protein